MVTNITCRDDDASLLRGCALLHKGRDAWFRISQLSSGYFTSIGKGKPGDNPTAKIKRCLNKSDHAPRGANHYYRAPSKYCCLVMGRCVIMFRTAVHKCGTASPYRNISTTISSNTRFKFKVGLPNILLISYNFLF